MLPEILPAVVSTTGSWFCFGVHDARPMPAVMAMARIMFMVGLMVISLIIVSKF
jgi:hypothetical protein